MISRPFPGPARWVSLEPLLDAALDLPPEHRPAFLDAACAGDSALRAEIETMLAECDREDAGLEQPAARRFARLWDARAELERLRAALDDRYRVERELGRGGMGTVYLAHDQRHGRDVALKVLSAGPDDAGAARFLEEIRVTARLRHPNILPLFDSGVTDGLPWFVTPLLEGGTLRERLARDGPMPLADTRRVLHQVASALACAHARSVVHRDVKPENILLDESGAVLADFGIARAVARTAGGAQPTTPVALSRPGFGTPRYMAPELTRPGMSADHRVDLYALGVVGWEMLCGEAPEPGAERSAATLARLRPDVPDGLAGLVARLVSDEPDARPGSAEEVRQALERIAAPEPRAASAPAARRGLRALRAAGRSPLGIAAATWLAVAAAVTWGFQPSGRDDSPLDDGYVLVVPFENSTGDSTLAALGRMAADWVAAGLARTGMVEVGLESERTTGGGGGPYELARRRGAGTLVTGSYYLDGERLRLQTRITRVADRTLRAVPPVEAPRSAPQRLLEPLRQRVLAALAVTHDPQFTGWAMGTPPPTFTAYEQFVAGLDRFATGDWRGALPHWARAAALDSSFVQPLLQSIFGYLNLGRYTTADSLARLVAIRADLAPFDRAMLAYQRGEIDGDNTAALEGARAMVRAAPGAELPRYLHALAALRSNRPREALDAAAHLRSRSARFGTAWSAANYWRVVTDAHHLLGEHGAELRAARQARASRPDDRELLWLELRARIALGDLDGLDRELDRLETLPRPPAGRSLPTLLLDLADEIDAHGRGGARRVLLRADRWQRARGTREAREVEFRLERARLLRRLGDYGAADSLLAHLQAERPDDRRVLARRGLVLAERGDSQEARRIAEVLRARPALYDHGRQTYARARIAALLGDREAALALLRQALARGAPYGTDLHSDPAFATLRGAPAFRMLLRPIDAVDAAIP